MPLPSEFWFERRYSTPRCRFERLDSLKRRRPQAGRRLEQLPVFHAIGCPGNGLQPFRLDGFAIDDAAPEGAVLDPLQRVADLLQHRRLQLSFGKGFALPFVCNAVVSAITRRIGDLLPRLRPLVRSTSRKTRFEVEQSLLAMSSIHDALPTGATTVTPRLAAKRPVPSHGPATCWRSRIRCRTRCTPRRDRRR